MKTRSLIWVSFIVSTPLIFTLLTTDTLVLEHHGYRQSQTLLLCLNLIKNFDFFEHFLPVFGPPWRVPMEYPVYQILVSLLHKVIGVDPVYIGSTLSLLSLYGLCFVAQKLASREHQTITLMSLATSPVLVFYSNKFLIDLFAVSLSFLAFYLFLLFLEKKKVELLCFLAALLTVIGLQKITVLIPVGLGMLIYSVLNHKIILSFNRSLLIIAILCALVPLLISSAWIIYSDTIKSASYVMNFLTSDKMRADNFGTINDRLNFYFNVKVVIKLLLYTGVLPILTMLFIYPLRSIEELKAPLSMIFVGVMAPLLFFKLHVVHDYYFVMVAPYLIFGFINLFDLSKRRRKSYLLVAIILVINSSSFFFIYKDKSTGIAGSHQDFYHSALFIKENTSKNTNILSIGADWDSSLPLYSDRKFLMLPDWVTPSYSPKMALKEFVESDAFEQLGGIILCKKRLSKKTKTIYLELRNAYSADIHSVGNCDIVLKPNLELLEKKISLL